MSSASSGEQRRHRDDVDDLQRRAEVLDVLIQPRAHRAQLLADAQLLGLEVLDLLLLFGGEQQRATLLFAALRLQRGELFLGVVQLLLELLLLGMEALVGGAPQLLHALEGTREGGAAAHADQVGAAGRGCRARSAPGRRCLPRPASGAGRIIPEAAVPKIRTTFWHLNIIGVAPLLRAETRIGERRRAGGGPPDRVFPRPDITASSAARWHDVCTRTPGLS